MLQKRSLAKRSTTGLSQVGHSKPKSRTAHRLPITIHQHLGYAPLRALVLENSSDFDLLCAFAQSGAALHAANVFKGSTITIVSKVRDLRQQGRTAVPAALPPRPSSSADLRA